MSNHQLLDNVTHKDLRIITAQHPSLGDNQSYTRVFLPELKQVQSTYPIMFRKHGETGHFEIIAMFGLGESENLFLDENGWHAHYLPLSVQRRPFLIGFQTSQDPGSVDDNAVVHVDMDSPRVSQTEGELVFLPQGGQSPFLQHISSILRAIHEGDQHTQPFVNQLLALSLIETVDLKITLNDGNHIELNGLYTIHEENLQNLADADIASLHKAGYLEPIYMIIASMHNLTRLIEMKNQRL